MRSDYFKHARACATCAVTKEDDLAVITTSIRRKIKIAKFWLFCVEFSKDYFDPRSGVENATPSSAVNKTKAPRKHDVNAM